MRALHVTTLAGVLAGSMLAGSVGVALAGADDGGAEAFFDKTGPGSARGMVEPQSATQAAAATDAAAGSQPNASVSRTGVAQARRPHVAVTRMGQNTDGTSPHRTRVSVARHEAPRPTLTASHALAPHRVQHAMHRGFESHQS